MSDDAIMLRANAGRIGRIDLNDNKNYLGAKHLIPYAIEKDCIILQLMVFSIIVRFMVMKKIELKKIICREK